MVTQYDRGRRKDKLAAQRINQNKNERFRLRVRQIMKERNLNEVEYANRAGLPETFVRDFLDGKLLFIGLPSKRKLVTGLGLLNGRAGRFTADFAKYLTDDDCESYVTPKLDEQLEMEFDDRSEQ